MSIEGLNRTDTFSGAFTGGAFTGGATETLAGTVSETLPVHRAEDLTAGGNLAQILLAEQVYTLRITRAGKLILTK